MRRWMKCCAGCWLLRRAQSPRRASRSAQRKSATQLVCAARQNDKLEGRKCYGPRVKLPSSQPWGTHDSRTFSHRCVCHSSSHGTLERSVRNLQGLVTAVAVASWRHLLIRGGFACLTMHPDVVGGARSTSEIEPAYGPIRFVSCRSRAYGAFALWGSSSADDAGN